jgi:hypothetical protein
MSIGPNPHHLSKHMMIVPPRLAPIPALNAESPHHIIATPGLQVGMIEFRCQFGLTNFAQRISGFLDLAPVGAAQLGRT